MTSDDPARLQMFPAVLGPALPWLLVFGVWRVFTMTLPAQGLLLGVAESPPTDTGDVLPPLRLQTRPRPQDPGWERKQPWKKGQRGAARDRGTPGAPVLILGDFNPYKLEPARPGFERYIECGPREDKVLDKCHGNPNNTTGLIPTY